MKQLKHSYLIAAFACVFALGPTAGWSTRAFGDVVSGQITAVPLSGEIEVDHRIYHVKAGSPADSALHEFSEGQRVDLLLDGPPESKTSEVMSITLHNAS